MTNQNPDYKQKPGETLIEYRGRMMRDLVEGLKADGKLIPGRTPTQEEIREVKRQHQQCVAYLEKLDAFEKNSRDADFVVKSLVG